MYQGTYFHVNNVEGRKEEENVFGEIPTHESVYILYPTATTELAIQTPIYCEYSNYPELIISQDCDRGGWDPPFPRCGRKQSTARH